MDTKLEAVHTIVAGEKLERPLFRRIGTGLVNRAASLSIVLDALPLSGRRRAPETRRDEEPRSLKGGA